MKPMTTAWPVFGSYHVEPAHTPPTLDDGNHSAADILALQLQRHDAIEKGFDIGSRSGLRV